MSESFEFTRENLAEFEDILRRYPVKRAALLPTLHLVQEQHGWVPAEAESYVSRLLDVPVVDVREVLTFYSLYHRRQPGRHHIRVCMSLSCWLRGATRLKKHLGEKLGVPSGGVSEGGAFSWEAVADCMGACEIAPMVQLDKDYHGNLSNEDLDRLLEETGGPREI